MIRRPPRSTLDRSSAASDVYKRQDEEQGAGDIRADLFQELLMADLVVADLTLDNPNAVSYTHLRAHETVLDLVCRLLLEQKNQYRTSSTYHYINRTIPNE